MDIEDLKAELANEVDIHPAGDDWTKRFRKIADGSADFPFCKMSCRVDRPRSRK